jgi:hypothetical protein
MYVYSRGGPQTALAPRPSLIYCAYWSRDNAVGITIGYGLDDGGVGVRVPVRSRMFSTSSRSVLGSTQPPIEWVLGITRPEREADHISNQCRSQESVDLYTLPRTPSWRSA